MVVRLWLAPGLLLRSYEMQTFKQILNFDKTVSQTQILRIEDNAFIPFDPANTDYQAYLKWLEEGNQPLPAETPSEE